MARSRLLSPALCKVWGESDGGSSVVDQILVTSGSGAVSLLTQREGGGWQAEAVRSEGAWPCWRPGYAEIAVSVTREPQGSAVEVVELQPGGFRTNASFAISGEPNAIAPRVPHYVMWSPDGSILSVVSRAGETLGLTCFPAHGGAFGTEVTGAPIFSTWTCDSTRLVVHAGGFNLGLLMRTLFGIGTPRGLQGRPAAAMTIFVTLWTLVEDFWRVGSERSANRRFTVTLGHHFELLPVSLSERPFATGC